jgi:hypothetical protein
MWKKAVSLLVKDNLASLRYFQAHHSVENHEKIVGFVAAIIRGLPWFYRFPVMSLGMVIVLLDAVHFKNNADNLPNFIKKIPFYNMFNKLVKATTFLVLFDICSND